MHSQGEMIASVLFDDIASISDLDKTSFRVVTREPFGQSHKSEVCVLLPACITLTLCPLLCAFLIC